MTSSPLDAQITTTLLQKYSLPISPTYLTTFLTSQRHPLPPIASLVSTLHFRLLASDIALSLSQSAPLFPVDIASAATKERRLTAPINCQILDVQDIGASAYAQIEVLEMIERGEMVKGKEIVRTVNVEEANPHAVTSTAGPGSNANTATPPTKSYGPFKFTLQDAKGTKIAAFNTSQIRKLGLPLPGEEGGMSIGCKVVLKPGTVVSRGVVMMQARDLIVLGGKVEAWDKTWREGRKERLLAQMTASRDGRI